MSFLADVLKANTITLTPQSHIVVALDNSGSTSGDVLRREIELANLFADVFHNSTRIAWNSTAERVCSKTFRGVRSHGGTCPDTFVDYMLTNGVSADLLLLITDGQITEIDAFRTKFGQLALQCPIIVVLTVYVGDVPDATIEDCGRVDMSIVEACLTASSNVAVLVQHGEASDARFFQGTGYFAQFVNADSATPASERRIADMSRIDFSTLWKAQTNVVATTFSECASASTLATTSVATSAAESTATPAISYASEPTLAETSVSQILNALPASPLGIVTSIASAIMSYFSATAAGTASSSATLQEADDVAQVGANASQDIAFAVTMQQLPNDVVQLQDGRYLLLGALIEYCSTLDWNTVTEAEQHTLALALVEAAKRTSLPKLNVVAMRAALHNMRSGMDRYRNSDQVDAIKQRIYAAQMELALRAKSGSSSSDDDGENSDDIAALRLRVSQLRAELSVLLSQRERRTVVAELRNAVEALTLVLQQYTENKAAFDYGSNRATAARTIEEQELVDVGRCIRGQCPVMLEEDNLCIYLQAPDAVFVRRAQKKPIAGDDDDSDDKNEETPARPIVGQGALTDAQRGAVARYFTRNQMVDNAALCGVAMLGCLTPGVFGIEFARSTTVAVSPLTQMPLLGFVPLSFDMRVLIRHLCSLLCGGKEMPFILRAYVSMVAQHLATNRWAQKELCGHAQYVLGTLKLQCRFVREHRIATLRAQGKSQNEAAEAAARQEITLAESIQYQLTHTECLRLLSHGQAMAMVDIAQQLMPDFTFDVARARGVANFCNTLRLVRDRYIALDRARRDPQEILFECFRADGTLRNTLHGYLAWFFASTHRRLGHALRLLRFQDCVDRVLEDGEMGAYFTSIYAGVEPPAAGVPPLLPAIDEPSAENVHFDTAKSLEFYTRLLRKNNAEICCAYCGERFVTRHDLNAHLKQTLGAHFIDFSQILLYKRDLFDAASALATEKAIFTYLQRRYNVWHMAIYTQRTRREIRAMIQAVAAVAANTKAE